MEKILLLLACAITGTNITHAQLNTWQADSVLSRFCIDVNLRSGMLLQDITATNTSGNYLNAVNSNTGSLKLDNAYSLGGELQAGYFFGRMRHFGVGLGASYYYHAGDMSLQNYHVEYQSADFNGNSYRQLITANKLAEHVTMTSINIPLVLKYKNRFSKHWGFTADAGIVYNVQMSNSWKTDASFDYEAIYKFTDGSHTVYDNATVPDAGDYFITKANFIKDNPGGDVQAYFNSLRGNGYNVGLGVQPATKSGKVSYTSGSVRFMLKPSANLFLSDHIALDLGVYYMYQPYKNNAQAGYRVPEKMGDYNSVLNSVSSAKTQSFGLNLGVRVFLGKVRDRDHDGVPDKKDLCPDDSGLVQFQGCPDSDGDGIIDKNDSCPKVKGIAKFYGCPDSDDDGIQDKDDECPFVKGLVQFHGCPDKDGDGIPDKNDDCPDVAGLPQYHGCPDKDGDGLPDNIDKCPDVAGLASNYGCPEIKVHDTFTDVDVNTPILFEVNKTTIKEESLPVLRKAVEELKSGRQQSINIDGHTDNTGADDYNMGLSLMRAQAVKRMLVSMGADEKKIHIKGYGEEKPATSNKTREGRMKNRRAVMKLK